MSGCDGSSSDKSGVSCDVHSRLTLESRIRAIQPSLPNKPPDSLMHTALIGLEIMCTNVSAVTTRDGPPAKPGWTAAGGRQNVLEHLGGRGCD